MNTTVTSAAPTVGEKRSLGHARYRFGAAGCWGFHSRARDPLFVNILDLMGFRLRTKTKTKTLCFFVGTSFVFTVDLSSLFC